MKKCIFFAFALSACATMKPLALPAASGAVGDYAAITATLVANDWVIKTSTDRLIVTEWRDYYELDSGSFMHMPTRALAQVTIDDSGQATLRFRAECDRENIGWGYPVHSKPPRWQPCKYNRAWPLTATRQLHVETLGALGIEVPAQPEPAATARK